MVCRGSPKPAPASTTSGIFNLLPMSSARRTCSVIVTCGSVTVDAAAGHVTADVGRFVAQRLGETPGQGIVDRRHVQESLAAEQFAQAGGLALLHVWLAFWWGEREPILRRGHHVSKVI